MPALVSIAVGLVLGSMSAGRLGRLTSIDIGHPGIVAALFAVQAVLRGRIIASAGLTGKSGIIAWAVVSVLLIAYVCSGARRLRGLWLIVCGWSLNLLVVLANGGMPTSISTSSGGFYHLLGAGDVFIWLADILPAGPWLLSIGDVLSFVGVITLVSAGMHEAVQAQGVDKTCPDSSILQKPSGGRPPSPDDMEYCHAQRGATQ